MNLNFVETFPVESFIQNFAGIYLCRFFPVAGKLFHRIRCHFESISRCFSDNVAFKALAKPPLIHYNSLPLQQLDLPRQYYYVIVLVTFTYIYKRKTILPRTCYYLLFSLFSLVHSPPRGELTITTVSTSHYVFPSRICL